MKNFIILITALGLSGCAAGQTTDCAYRDLIGKDVYSADLQKLRDEGKDVRLLYPDSFIGFQKNPNRINVTRDENDQIVAVSCG